MGGIFSWIKRKRHIETERVVYINEIHRNAHFHYAANKVKTSRYTIWTFIPKNLFEQFRRFANCYFLMMAILQVIAEISPGLNNVYAAFAPLVFVLLVSTIKEGIEDFRRHRMDDEMNNKKANVLQDGVWKTAPWKSMKVGEIIKVEKNHDVPADIILISSSNNDGVTFIETANLDGETNLKIRQAPQELVDFGDDVAKLNQPLGLINCDTPNANLSEFTGKLTLPDGSQLSLSNSDVILRGCTIRNTSWITGAIIYSGKDTKVMQNSLEPRSKMSSLEGLLNQAFFFIIVFLVVMLVICTICYRTWFGAHGGVDNLWYLEADTLNLNLDAFIKFWGFLILLQNVIPISLYVTIEIVKVCHALYINSDREMYDENSNTPAHARTSNLGEELGQIDYVFSDKTGTLTQNVMEFLKVSFGGVSYGKTLSDIAQAQMLLEGKIIPEPSADEVQLTTAHAKFPFRDASIHRDMKGENGFIVREAVLNLALCNTVIPEEDDSAFKGIRYEAASPDEATLVDAAKNLGFTLVKRNQNTLWVKDELTNETTEYKLHAINEFSSDRKRMSVVIELPNGTYRLYVKGADSAIEALLGPDQPLLEVTKSHLNEFANEGLRTLMLAYRDLSLDEFRLWMKLYTAGGLELGKERTKLFKQCAEEIEHDLILLGGTAIEDKLQVGVPETIARLLAANIKVWMLTGDKTFTAINIGFACRLLQKGMDVITIDGKADNHSKPTSEETKRQLENAEFTIVEGIKSGKPHSWALVIEGPYALDFVLSDSRNEGLTQLFIRVTSQCRSVICSRCFPVHKADIVTAVVTNIKSRTLAIGDGANDVPMIQSAHVGVGISGKEGMQAVLASDYSIAQFRFLSRLLLVHGRWDYRRVSITIIYMLFKNILKTCVQFFWQFHSGFSCGTVNDVWSIAGWNIFFSAIPIFIVAALDKDVSAEASLKEPRLYISGQKNQEFNLRIFFVDGMLYSFICSAVCFYIPYGIFGISDVMNGDGRALGVWDFGYYTFAMAVFVSNFRLYLMTRVWHWSLHLAIWGSIAFWIIFELIYHAPVVSAGLNAAEQMGISYMAFANPNFYWCALLTIILCLLPNFTYLSLRSLFYPYRWEVVAKLERDGELKDSVRIESGEGKANLFISDMKNVDKSSGKLAKPKPARGFAFSQGKNQRSFLDVVYGGKRKPKNKEKKTKPIIVELDSDSEEYINKNESFEKI